MTGGDTIPLREATKTWFAISLQTFGGPAGQFAVMHHTLVDEKALDRAEAVHACPARTEQPGC